MELGVHQDHPITPVNLDSIVSTTTALQCSSHPKQWMVAEYLLHKKHWLNTIRNCKIANMFEFFLFYQLAVLHIDTK